MAAVTSTVLPTFEEQLSFGTSASLGLPDLIGGASGVMGFSAPAPVVDGFLVKPGFAGTAPLKSYSLALDIYVDDAYKSKWFALLQTDPTNTSDAEFLVNPNSGIGINGSYNGTFTWDAWHRVVLTVQDLGTGKVTLTKYLDGVQVGSQAMDTSRYQIDPVKGFMLFSDDGATPVSLLETQPGFVSSVMFTDQVLTKAEVTALGGASASGILATALPAGQTVQFDFNAAAPLAPSFGTGVLRGRLRGDRCPDRHQIRDDRRARHSHAWPATTARTRSWPMSAPRPARAISSSPASKPRRRTARSTTTP
jgi:hypothetical protein